MNSPELYPRVLLLVGADGDASQGRSLESESTPLIKLLGESATPIEIDVVSLGASREFDAATVHARLELGGRSVIDSMLNAAGVFALRERFAKFPIGRLLNSLGPVAPSRVYWRALKRHPGAMLLLRSSDAVIATDLETTKAAWLAVHRGWVRSAYYDRRAVAVVLALDTRPPTPT